MQALLTALQHMSINIDAGPTLDFFSLPEETIEGLEIAGTDRDTVELQRGRPSSFDM